MSYRCGTCGVAVPPGQKRRVILRHRTIAGRSEIAHETPVCEECHRLHQLGRLHERVKPAKPKPVVVKQSIQPGVEPDECNVVFGE